MIEDFQSLGVSVFDQAVEGCPADPILPRFWRPIDSEDLVQSFHKAVTVYSRYSAERPNAPCTTDVLGVQEALLESTSTRISAILWSCEL